MPGTARPSPLYPRNVPRGREEKGPTGGDGRLRECMVRNLRRATDFRQCEAKGEGESGRLGSTRIQTSIKEPEVEIEEAQVGRQQREVVEVAITQIQKQGQEELARQPRPESGRKG